MKAIVWTAYGGPDVLQMRDLPTPTPADDEVLVRVRAATVTAGDTELRDLSFPLVPLRLPMRLFVGLRRPRRVPIMGTELAGLIEAVGDDVTRFTVGDAVLAHTGTRFGAQAQYACVPADGLVAGMPAGASFAEAAALPNGGMEAFTLLRRAGVGPDQRVAIIGAGGSIGTMAVQLAAHLGARVTAVDAADKLAMLRSIGAHRTIYFRQADVTADGPWDLVFDVPGCRHSLPRSRR